MSEKVQLLIVTGPVGVGKTSVAASVSDLMNEKNIPNALIDIDALRCAYPAPQNDRFNMSLGYKNLSLILPNYYERGISRFIIPDVIENSESIKQFKSVIPTAEITIIRLTASLSTLHKRLEQREVGDMLTWHKNRAVELSAILDEVKPEDLLIDTEGKPVLEAAKEALKFWMK